MCSYSSSFSSPCYLTTVVSLAAFPGRMTAIEGDFFSRREIGGPGFFIRSLPEAFFFARALATTRGSEPGFNPCRHKSCCLISRVGKGGGGEAAPEIERWQRELFLAGAAAAYTRIRLQRFCSGTLPLLIRSKRVGKSTIRFFRLFHISKCVASLFFLREKEKFCPFFLFLSAHFLDFLLFVPILLVRTAQASNPFAS